MDRREFLALMGTAASGLAAQAGPEIQKPT